MYKKVERTPDLSREDFEAAVLRATNSHKVVHVTGVDPGTDLRTFYDALITSLGQPFELAEDAETNQRNGQRWFEVRFDPAITGAYRHSCAAQPLHTDGSYIASSPEVTLMYCVSRAPSGGETIFIDADDVVSLLEANDPALLHRLRSTPMTFEKVGDRKQAPIVDEDAGGVVLNWNYYCVAKDQPAELKGLAEEFFEFQQQTLVTSSAVVAVGLNPGEAVLFRDRRLLHGRNDFTASTANDRFLWKAFVNPAAVA